MTNFVVIENQNLFVRTHFRGLRVTDFHPVNEGVASCNGNETMGKTIKKANFWVRRKSHLPILVIGSLMVILLLFNDDTSISLNMEYEHRINELNEEIAQCRDSAEYYRRQRENIIHGTDDLEKMAREKFHMQRPSEDVYILK